MTTRMSLVAALLIAVACRAADYRDYDALVATIPAVDVAQMLARDDQLYFVAGGSLRVVDLSDIGQPRLAATLAIGPDFRRALSVDDNLLFLQSAFETKLFDVSDPLHPVAAGSFGGVGPLALCDGWLLAGSSRPTSVLDVRDPAHPVDAAPQDLGGTLIGGWQGGALVFRDGEYENEAIPHYLERVPIRDGLVSGPGTVLDCYVEYFANEIDRFDSGRLQSFGNATWAMIPLWCWQFDVGQYNTAWCPRLDGVDAGLRTAAESLSPVIPEQFNVAVGPYECRIAVDDGCGRRHLVARASGASDVHFAVAAGLACGEGDRLFIASNGQIRIYDLAGRGSPAAVPVYDSEWPVSLTNGGDGADLTWLEDRARCVSQQHPWGMDYWIENDCALLRVETGPSNAVAVRLPLSTLPAAALSLRHDLVVSAFPGPAMPLNAALVFQQLDAAAPYASIPDIAARQLELAGPFLLATGDRTLWVVDVSDPLTPQLTATVALAETALALGGWPGGTAIGVPTGVLLLVADGSGTWSVAGRIDLPAPVSALECAGSTLSVAAGNTISFHDIGDPSNPVAIGAVTTLAPAQHFAVSGPVVYAACGDAGLLVYVRNGPLTAQLAGGYPLDFVSDVAIRDGRLLLATSHGLKELPLQDGDPLPSYAPLLTTAVNDRGDVTLTWPAPVGLAIGTRLERLDGGTRVVIPHTVADNLCQAVDRRTSDAASLTYAVMAGGAGGNWYEAARAEVDLAASAVWLLPPSPNPSRLSTTIRFRLPRESEVKLEVLDLAGRRLRLLARRVELAGMHEAVWDGRDDRGRPVSAGSYLLRLEAGSMRRTVKVAVVR